MILHLLKLVWNRKRATSLLIVEITCAFLLLFAVVAVTAYVGGSYAEPLGFEYENVWNVAIDMKVQGEVTPEQSARLARLLTEARNVDGVEAAAAVTLPPFEFGSIESIQNVNGRDVTLEFNEVSDDLAKVLGIEVARGRWFERSDDTANSVPVVIDEDTAEAIFGSSDPIGQFLDDNSNPRSKVVGVIREFRKNGELSPDTNFVLQRKRVDDQTGFPPSNILVRVRPGATAELEEKLRERLDAVAGDWSVEIGQLTDARAAMRRTQLTPIAILAVVAGFLLLMVAFGLSGVLWQSITMRRSELGLRRAIGATGNQIHRQVLLELLLIATLGLALGTIVVLQIPILGLFPAFKASQFVAAFALAVSMMYGMTALCGLYPSWLATRIQPADALRSE